MARSGSLPAIGVAAQPAGSRRRQGRRPASRQAAAPALSGARAAQQLEQRLEVQLLERSTRSVSLTAPGEELLDRLVPILDELDLALAETRHERVLRIGFEWALPEPWAANLLDGFETSTGIRVELTRHDGAPAALAANQIDVVLTRQRLDRLDQLNRFETIALFDEERVAAVSARSPLADRDRVAFTELAQHPLVVNTASGSTWPELWPSDSRPRDLRECKNYDEWLTLIAADRGVGTTPISSTQTHDHAGVRYLRLDGAPPVILHLVHRSGDNRPMVRRLKERAHI